MLTWQYCHQSTPAAANEKAKMWSVLMERAGLQKMFACTCSSYSSIRGCVSADAVACGAAGDGFAFLHGCSVRLSLLTWQPAQGAGSGLNGLTPLQFAGSTYGQ
jgi:hypothetical protein